MGVFRLDPAAVKDQDELELDLIDHGLEEMGREASATRANPSSSSAVRSTISASCRRRSKARGIAPLSAEHEYICAVPVELPEEQAAEVLGVF